MSNYACAGVFSLLFLLLAACGNGGAAPAAVQPAPQIKIEANGPCLTWIDGYSKLNREVRVLKITVPKEAPFPRTVVLTPASSTLGLRVAETGGSLSDGSLTLTILPGHTACVPVYFRKAPAFSEKSIGVKLKWVDAGASNSTTVDFEIARRPNSIMRSFERVADKLGIDTSKWNFVEQPIGKPGKKKDGRQSSVPVPQNEMVASVSTWVEFDTPLTRTVLAGMLGGDFDGWVLEPTLPELGLHERWFLQGVVLDGELDLAGLGQTHRWTYAMDEDGDPGNNFLPRPGEEFDWRKEMDKFLQVVRDTVNNLRLLVYKSQANDFQEVTSAAVAVILGNFLCFMLPEPEAPRSENDRLISSQEEADGFVLSIDVYPEVSDGGPTADPNPVFGQGSEEARELDGFYILDDQSPADRDHCIQILNGTIVSWDEGCDGSDEPILQSQPGRTATSGVHVIWEVTLPNGRYRLTHHFAGGVISPTALDFFAPGDPFGVRVSAPVMTPRQF